MVNLAHTNGASGLEFENQDAIMTLQSITCAKGDVLAVDFDTVDSSGRYTHVRAVATADFITASNAVDARSIFCVALEAQSVSGGKVRVRFKGVVDALIAGSPPAIAVGDRLIPTNAARTLTETTTSPGAGSGHMVVAMALEVNTTAGSFSKVLFDGIHGFGQHINTTA